MLTNMELQTQDLLNLSHQIVEESTQNQTNWLLCVSNVLSEWTKLETKTMMAQAQILWEVWSIWEADNNPDQHCLAMEAKSFWGNDFFKWAKSYTQNSSAEPSDITIGNKISVYRDWIADPIIEYPEYVYIPKRDDYGQLIEQDLGKDEAWEKIKFDPSQSDYSKLLVSRATARQQIMTPEAWSAVADPYTSVEKLKHEIRKPSSPSSAPSTFEIHEQDGIIYGVEGDQKVAVLQALFENQCPVFNKTLTHILKAAGLKVPLQYR